MLEDDEKTLISQNTGLAELLRLQLLQLHLSAQNVRNPRDEPPKKPRKKPAKKKKVGGQSSAGLKRVENILVPGLNAPKGSNKAWLAEQRRIWA